MRIALCAGLTQEPWAGDHLGLAQGLDEIGAGWRCFDNSQENPRVIAHQINAYKPDLVFHNWTESLTQRLPSLIDKRIKQFYWMLDYQPYTSMYVDWDGWASQGEYLDHIFISNYDQIGEWETAFETSTSYLPHGGFVRDLEYDDSLKKPAVFVGGMIDQGWYKSRHDLVKEIQKLTPVEIINSHDREERNEIWKNIHKIYHSADTVLDISHSWEARGYASGRYFYMGAYGACAIAKRFPGCEDLYPEGTKLYFDTPEQAANLIYKYQNNKKARDKVKLLAYEWNKENHSYTQRWRQIIKYL